MSDHSRPRAFVVGCLRWRSSSRRRCLRTGAAGASIDDFFRTFTDEWVRSNPNQAIQARYFTGPEQDALEVQMTPLTREWRHRRIEMARRGLAELAKFDGASADRCAARVCRSHEVAARGRGRRRKVPRISFFRSSSSPAPISIWSTRSPWCTRSTRRRMRSNYVRVLGRSPRAWRRPPPKRVISPPKEWCRRASSFAPRSRRCSSSSASPPAQNPYVTVFVERMAASGEHSAGTNARSCGPKPSASRPRRSILHGRRRSPCSSRSLPTTTDDAGLWRFKGGDAVVRVPASSFHVDGPVGGRDPSDWPARGGAHRNRDGRHPAAARAQRMAR